MVKETQMIGNCITTFHVQLEQQAQPATCAEAEVSSRSRGLEVPSYDRRHLLISLATSKASILLNRVACDPQNCLAENDKGSQVWPTIALRIESHNLRRKC